MKRFDHVVGAMGVAVCGIGVATLIGYQIDVPVLYSWWGTTPMAINTACAFICEGSAIAYLASSWRR